MHAVTSCDITCALFQKGKVSTFKNFQKNNDLYMIVAVFNNPAATHENIFISGCKFLLAAYRAPHNSDV